jgi:urease accessory protein
MHSNQMIRKAGPGLALSLLSLLAATPALAHHPFGMPEGSGISVWQGVISGIGHPLLGPDHLLFLLAIALVGLSQPRRWVLPLLALGLGGSLVSQLIPLPAALETGAEALVSLTLVLEGLVILGRLPVWLLLPAISLHGYLLGGAVIGAEPAPLLAYGLGLLIGQGLLLLAVTSASSRLIQGLGSNGRQILAGIWIGIGAAFTWSLLVP